jgi:hypothetical protein
MAAGKEIHSESPSGRERSAAIFTRQWHDAFQHINFGDENPVYCNSPHPSPGTVREYQKRQGPCAKPIKL